MINMSLCFLWYIYIYIFKTCKLQIFNYLQNLMSAACTLLGPLPDSVQSSVCNKKVIVTTFNSVSCCYNKAPFTYRVLKFPSALQHFCHYCYISVPYLTYPLFGTCKLQSPLSSVAQWICSEQVLLRYCSGICANFQQILQLQKNIYC